MADPLIQKRYTIYEGRTHLEMLPVPDLFLDGDYNTNTELFLEFMDTFFKETFGAIRKDGWEVSILGNDVVVSLGELWWGKFVFKTTTNSQLINARTAATEQFVYMKITYKRYTLDDDLVPVTTPQNVFIRQEVNGVELSRPNQYIYDVELEVRTSAPTNSVGNLPDNPDITYLLLGTISTDDEITMNVREFGKVLSDIDFDAANLPDLIAQNAANIQLLFDEDPNNAKKNEDNHFTKSNSNAISVATFDSGPQQIQLSDSNLSTINVSGTLEVLTLSAKSPGTTVTLKLEGGGIMKFVHSSNLIVPGGNNLSVTGGNWVSFTCSATGVWEIVSNSTFNTALLIQQGGVPLGGIIGYEGTVSEFDGTGLGFGSMTGWAICNGNNGTGDMRGRNLTGLGDDPQFKDKFDVMGEYGGAVDRVIGANNLPSFVITGSTDTDGVHSHQIDQDLVQYGVVGPDSLTADNTIAGSPQIVNTDVDGAHSHNVTLNYTGTNDPMPILAPYYVAIWIKRVS